MNDITAVFNDEVVEEVAEDQEVVEAANESEKVEAPEVESKEEPKEPEKAETTSEEEAEKESWTFQAVKDERRKRQAEEERSKDLERQLAELRAGKEKPEELPDVFENQEEFAKSLEDRMTQKARAQIIQTQRDMMIEFKSDYEEKEAAFIEFGKDNPALIAQANASPNPAKFAYEQGTKYLKFQQMQDVDTMEAKLRTELEAKIRAEYESKQKSVEEKGANLTPSLANARGTVEAEESVPENPGDLF
jgi:hypothetical protein